MVRRSNGLVIIVKSYEYSFRSRYEILDIQSLWQSLGPYDWKAFDNDTYGIYIVARRPELNLRLKLVGEPNDYVLSMDFGVPVDDVASTREALFRQVFEALLPAVEATDVRAVDTPPQKSD